MASKLPPLSFKLKLLKFAGKLLLAAGLLVSFVGHDVLPPYLLPPVLMRLLYSGLLIPLGLVLLVPVWVAHLRALLQRVQDDKAAGGQRLQGIAAAAGALPPDPAKVAALVRQMQKEAAGAQSKFTPRPQAAGKAASGLRTSAPVSKAPAQSASSAVSHVGEPAVRRRNSRTTLIRR